MHDIFYFFQPKVFRDFRWNEKKIKKESFRITQQSIAESVNFGLRFKRSPAPASGRTLYITQYIVDVYKSSGLSCSWKSDGEMLRNRERRGKKRRRRRRRKVVSTCARARKPWHEE